MPPSDLQEKLSSLRKLLREQRKLVVAYSGGVDSSLLLAVAHETLAHDSLGVIADSPSLPRQALQEALSLAKGLGANVEVISTLEMTNPDYATNPPNRCYFCKAELFDRLDSLAHARGYAAIAYGENADDARQVRPGRLAAAEFRVLAPLKDAGLTKEEIRCLSRAMHLPTADAPAQPCLSSRIPYGTPVTLAALAQIERAEAAVRALGFRVFRVRHHLLGDVTHARVQISLAENAQLERMRDQLIAVIREAGYAEVTIDPEGYHAPAA